MDETIKPSAESIDKPEYVYTGVFLDENSRDKLLYSAAPYVPNDWDIIADHMTVMHPSEPTSGVAEYAKQHQNEVVKLFATQIGISPEAIAVNIDTDIPSVNPHKHITVAVPPGGKAYRSNFIENWQDLPEPVELTGVLLDYFALEAERDDADNIHLR